MNNVGAVTVYNNVNAQVVRLTFLFAPITTQGPGNGAPMGGGLNTP